MLAQVDVNVRLLFTLSAIFLCLELKTLGNGVVPGLHGIVWLVWQAGGGEHLGECVAGHGINDIELLHRILQDRHMDLRAEQQLYRLPRYKALPLQRGNRRR
jgi:hypothetical protein